MGAVGVASKHMPNASILTEVLDITKQLLAVGVDVHKTNKVCTCSRWL